jgi:frataxin
MNDFHIASEIILNMAADFFDSTWPDADVDLLGDVLTVTLSTGQQYVINKHGVTRQIWLSSPFTGAHHFLLSEGQWVCTRTGTPFEDFLVRERNAHAA